MKTLNMKRISFVVAVTMIVILVAACLGIATVYVESQEGTTEFGTYTFDREMVVDGETVYFYESGDSSYHYSHDSDGFILIRDEDNSTLTYATCVNGAPVSSGVSYTASSYAINRVDKMTIEDIDFASNSDLYMDGDYYSDTAVESTIDISSLSNSSASNSSALEVSTIYNVTIYIMFADDSTSQLTYLQNNPLGDSLNGDTDSLASYYDYMTYGGMDVISIFPYTTSSNDIVFVYQSSNKRSYYNVAYSSTTSTPRTTKEKELLTSAVNAASSYFDFTGVDLDVDNDGYVDSINFLISGSDSDDWGNLLWPHSWSFTGFGSSDTMLGGVICNSFLFSFTDDVSLGTLCHEFFHVLGAPDYYHYDCGTCYDIPVGYWDLMANNYDTPQLPLTYNRQEYLGFVGDNQVVEIDSSGIYTLEATALSTADSVLAYKIATDDPDQFIWLEYRSNEVGGWDSVISGSGLIVYRTDSEAIEGNRYGDDDNDDDNPDEMYVFRPDINFANYNSYYDGVYSLQYAYMSPDNEYFSSYGSATITSKYSSSCIYLSNGTNTGIVIEAISRTSETIEFVVKLNGTDVVEEDYFVNSIDATSAEYYNGDFAGVKVELTLTEFNIYYLSKIEIKIYSASGLNVGTMTTDLDALREAYNSGQRSYTANFVISDNGNTIDFGVFTGDNIGTVSAPTYVEIYVTDADLTKTMVQLCTIDTKNISWELITTSQRSLGASISTTETATLATTADGSVVASASQWDFSGYENIIAVSATDNYAMLLSSSLEVSVVSLDSVARSAITNWTGIIAVEAQTNGAFALDSVGNVYQSGSIVSSTALSSWSEIYVISASDTHLVGIKSDGTVEALGDNTYGQTDVSSWSNIKAIAAADTFTAGLNFDGTVIITGSLTNSTEVATWTDIVDISASDDYLIGLKSDGTVVACGANSSSECDVSDLYDIIDISASINYGAFLRTDGVVVYKGSVESQYNLSVSKLSTNLIYDNYISTTGVYIDLASTTYYIGDVLDLNATISPTDATYQRILYTSSDESVATISSAGTITAKGEGTVTLTAEAYGTSYSDSITITIEPKYALEDMSFEDESRVVLLNNTILLNLIFNPTNATITGTITYSVDSTSATYITVDDNGLVTGIKETMTSAIIYSYATVTATLVQDGVTYTATCQITVQSNITKLAWNSTPTKTEYLYGESLDVSGGSVNITYATGVFTTTTVTESLDSSKVSGYNSNKLGAQTLTITYGEETLTYNINVSNYATGISADSTKTLKTTFNVEDDFSLGSGSFVVTMADGTTISIDEADSNLNISHTDTKLKEMGTHTVIVSYIYDEKEFIYTYAITVSDRVTGINAAAIATEYTYLSEIDSTISVVLTYYSGKTSNVPLSLCTVTGYESNVLGYQTVTVGYTDNTGSTFTNDQTLRVVFSGSVDVINNDTDTSALDKTSPVLYYKDEIPSITVIFTINSTDYIVPLYDETASQDYYYVISGLDSSATYGESYNVNVELYILSTNGNVYSYSKQEPSQQILLQLIHKPVATYITSAETVYYGFTPEAEISFLYDDGTISSPVEISNITIDSYIIGTQTAYFKYSGTIYSFDIEVVDYVVGLQDIADVTIEIGDEFDIDAVVFAQMASGAVEQLAVNQYSRSQCDLTLTGVSQNINIVYEGDMGSYSTSFTLLVLDKVVAVTMVTSFKTEYLYGEEFDYTSSYYVTYVSGNTEIIDYDASLFAFAFGSPDFDNSTSFANTVVDSQTVYVQYAPAAITITAVTVTVSDYIESVTAYLAQTTYSYNEDIAITVYIKMASKSNSEPVYNFTTTYIPTTVGVQDIYVTHEGITVYAGQVEVIDGVRSVSFTGTGRTWFYYGEAFTYIGRTLTVTHESGAVVVYENDDIAAMLQNTYDCTKEGSSKVVFTLCDSVNIAENNVYFSYNEYIKVYAETSATKPSINSSATSAYIYSDSTAFVFTESVTHAELSASIALIDYLTLVAVVDGQDIDLSDTESYVPNGAIAYIVNGDGTIIYTYSIVVVGDLNCDGLINGEDMADIADAYIDDSYQYSDALDLNGDGYFSLTDIVLWAERTSAPANVPVQEVAEIWVTDIKEDGDEE